jgi:ABC-type bacteriocin/lantibiotic exporter with double-glycine peptidase domain
VEAQAMSVGALSAASLLGGRIVMFFGSIASVMARLKEFRHAMRHLDDLVASEAVPSASGDAPLAVAPRIVLSGLAFGYGAQGGGLSDIDLAIAPGAFVAVVGRAGSGKSTLLKVLSGSLRPTSGAYSVGDRVVVDNRDRVWLAGVVAVKPQDASLTRGTFADTVREWAGDASDEAVSRALRESGFAEALDAAAIGTNSIVEPAGSNLSGGQRQMLAMARVFASGRRLLILDEPTAGLDGTSEQAILAALRSRRGVATVVTATHSPDVIALADRVIVVDGGRIVADVAPGAVLGATAARERPPAAVKPISLTQAA